MNLPAARLFILFALPLILGVAQANDPSVPTGELHRGIEYRGAGGFFSLSKITVVYPAGTGEPVEKNRRSAEARAKWLASVHKAKAVVAADDQLTAEDLRGNLLLLGWSNRVFGTKELARPFTHDGSGTAFLGLREPDRNVDLLVFHRNPYNWSSFVLFWSRIDPERDRFQVVPRVGSDWALYKNFEPTRQGMFVPARTWLPTRDDLAEGSVAGDQRAQRGASASFDSEHYHIVFDRALLKDGDVHAIAMARESAFAKAVSALGASPNPFRIQLFVYENEDSKRDATGVGDPTHAIPASREMHATRRFALSSVPREELHILARELYGPCYLTSIYEGLAISAENSLEGEDIELHAARLRSTGALPPLDDIIDEERFRAQPPRLGAAAAGVFMTWVRQSYGPAGVKKMYGLLEGPVARLSGALGVSEDALQTSFASWTDARVTIHKAELQFIDAEAEAQRAHEASDWPGMTGALKKALRSKPGDPQTLFNLASAQLRANDLAGAESSLKELLAAPPPPGGSRFRLFGHYQLGRVYDLAGRRAEALAEYDAVLALPDEHGAHDLARERKAAPATRDQLE